MEVCWVEQHSTQRNMNHRCLFVYVCRSLDVSHPTTFTFCVVSAEPIANVSKQLTVWGFAPGIWLEKINFFVTCLALSGAFSKPRWLGHLNKRKICENMKQGQYMTTDYQLYYLLYFWFTVVVTHNHQNPKGMFILIYFLPFTDNLWIVHINIVLNIYHFPINKK